jgi:hypothetical protein
MNLFAVCRLTLLAERYMLEQGNKNIFVSTKTTPQTLSLKLGAVLKNEAFEELMMYD